MGNKINANILENNYYTWLKKNLDFNDDTNGYISITTPFVDNSFDNITIYARPYGNSSSFVLTDLGDTLFNLMTSGLTIKKNTKRYEILNDILNNFGIKCEKNKLIIETDLDNFASAKTALAQAIVNVYDLLYLGRENIIQSFNEEFSEYLFSNDIQFIPNMLIPINGISANINFNFAIPKSKNNHSEKLIRTINNNGNVAEMAKVFNYDVNEAQSSRKDSNFILIINDNNKIVKTQNIDIAKHGLDSRTNVYPYSKIKNDASLLLSAS